MTEEPPPEPANHISGEVSGAALQVGTVHGDMYVGFPSASPAAEPVPVDPPTSWSDLPELPPKIVSLLRAQVRNAEKMPYRLRGARRTSLSTVYVRQDVTTGTDLPPSAQARPLPVLDSKGRLIDVPGPPAARITVRPPSRSMPEALDSSAHLLVTGGPGQGKSTLSLRLAADVARHWEGAGGSAPLSEPVVPLRVTARALATRLELPFFEALAETVRGEYGAMLAHPPRPDDLAGRLAGCRWLLLVDGLDEVADTTVRDLLVTVLATWASDATAAYRVVLTTRPIEGATLAPFQSIGAARYELLPFDEEAFRRFAENWFAQGSGDAKTFLRQIRDAHLDELVRVPLLATIAAIIFDEYADRPLPDNQYELYETYLDYLRSAHPVQPGPFDSCCGSLMEYLGRVRLEEDTSLVTAACRRVGAELPGLGAETGWREQLVEHLAAVGPFLRRGDDLGFLHHSFAEHLAATAKARQLPATFDSAHQEIVGLLHAAEPEERGRYARRVLVHYTRLHPAEADRLIRYLHDGGPQQHLLAGRLLAWHVPAGTEVVDAFLATARAWAATTQHPGGEILAEVSRAAHHPGLVIWLQALMRDGGMPWPSRVEAAVALGTRLDNDARDEAVETLRQAVQSAAVDVQARLNAAEALSQCGDGEREAAVNGLLAVLDSPAATAVQHGDAAVVMAGLGAEPRARAIDALTAVLENPSATDQDLVAAARSLLDIDFAHHERCAAVFRAVLHRPSWPLIGIEDAARGLSSLGPEYSAEAAAALEHRIADPRLQLADRIDSARALSQLGPQHRTRAGELVVELATGLAGHIFDKAHLGSLLADCGPEFRVRAVALARSTLDDPAAVSGSLLTVGSRLIDLGPDQWPDAVDALTRAANHSRGYDGLVMSALGFLATLGAPHRESAVARLRSALNRPESTSYTQLSAAYELASLGPEFHAEAVDRLVRLTAASLPLKTRLAAWRQLERFLPGMDQRASAEISRLPLGRAGAEAWGEGLPSYRWEVPEPDKLARLLERVVGDRALSGRQRFDAVLIVTSMHHRYHLAAARGMVGLIRDAVVSGSWLTTLGRQASRTGAATRRLVSDALRRTVLSVESRPDRVCSAAEAMAALDALGDDVLAALTKIAVDSAVDATSRCDAAVLLLRNGTMPPADAVATVLGLRAKMEQAAWIYSVRSAVEAGVDVVDDVRAIMLDRDTDCRHRQQAAVLLAEMATTEVPGVIAELRSQAEDPFGDAVWRARATTRLVTVDPPTVSGAAADFRATMVDERKPIDQRCDAAGQLAVFGGPAGEFARRTLVRLAGAPELTQGERGEALRVLDYFTPETGMTPLRLALAHDPAATSGKVRAGVLRDLAGKDSRSVGRALVQDRLVSPKTWSDRVSRWTDALLAEEAERALLDRLAGPESAPTARIEAAVALSRIAPALEPGAVRELEELARGRVATRRARRELAFLDNRWRGRVIAEAQSVLADAERPGRERAEAGFVVIELTSELPGPCRKDLEELLTDERIAGRLRLGILIGLRRMDDVRAVRDDQREPLWLRLKSANWLSGYSREDRSAAAELYQAIAAGSGCHPELRWRAARHLARLGPRGHELGTAALEALMRDETLPLTARRAAARRLGSARPDLRGDVLAVLRRFLADGDALARLRTWKAIGYFQPEEGTLGLLEMARDETLGPVVRCRSAWAAARLHRGHREAAAVVAREIAHDDQAPRHIRVSAAR
ncbi:hypothetical protein ACWEGE_11075, partial [Amycolatopsis sp. NPDC004747]